MDRAVESQNGHPPIFLFSIGYLEENKPNTNHRIIFGNLFTYNSVQPLDSIVWIFDRIAVSRGRSPRILRVPPKFLLPGGPEAPFPALSQINISVKKDSVNWSSFHICFHACYLPLVRNAWEVTKRKRPCTNAIQPETLGNGFLFAIFLVQTLTLPQIQVKYFVSLFIWRK